MSFNPAIHHRRSIRLPGYDYTSAGAYFITICTHNRQCLFGTVENGEMRMNEAGRIVVDEWSNIAHLREEIELDEWMVMPNHFHGIVVFTDHVGAIHELPLQMNRMQRRNMALPKLIGRFKMLSSKRVNLLRGTPSTPVWQRNFYERIIRNENELNGIREYIQNNPAQWEQDDLHPLRTIRS